MPAIVTHPPTASSEGCGTGTRLLIGLLASRWIAGIVENFGASGLSQLVALLLLGGLALMFLNRLSIPSNAILVFAGFAAWAATGVLSLASSPPGDPLNVKSIALLALLALYALFTAAAQDHLSTPSAISPLTRFLTAFIAVGAILSIYQVVTGHGFVEVGRENLQRAIGSDVHPVSFALQALAAAVGLEVLRLKSNQPFSIHHAGLLVLAALSIWLTYARTAWVMAILILSWLALSQANWWQRLGLLISGFILVTFAAVHTQRFSDLSSLPFFLENFSPSDVVFDYRYIDNSVSWRIVNWAYGVQQALEHPILGYGPGQSASASQFGLEMHDLLLESFFEGGIFGLASVLLVLAGLIRLHRRLPSQTVADRRARALTNAFGLGLLLAVLFSTSFVDQLMSYLLYIVMLSAASAPSAKEI